MPSRAAFSRRALIQRSAISAASLALPWPFLAGCSSDSGEAKKAPPKQTVDPSRPWWLQNDFAPVETEIEAFDLAVKGKIPPELAGLYVRNGSNPLHSDSAHWFFGDGMLHGLRLENGHAAWYRNRYVRTTLYEEGKGFGQSGPPGGEKSQSNVSVFHHAGRLLSSGEIGFPYHIDPSDLSTIGVYDFDAKLQTSFTAHPKIDPATGFLHAFGYGFLPPYLTYHVIDASGALVQSEVIPVEKPTMIHSFAITDQDVIFWELPVVFDLAAAIGGADNPYKWDASYGARLGVLPLGGKAAQIRWVEIEPCYVFHEVNAFRDGSEIVLDVVRHPDMFNGDDLGDKPSTISRWKIDTAGEALTFSEDVVADLQFELPSHDRRNTGRKHRYAWFVDTRENPDTLELGGIGRIDFDSGSSESWDPGVTRHADEPFFVPAGDGEGDGYLLSFVYDHARDASSLVILDATAITKGPIAEIAIPQRVPHGFHGVWLPDSV